MPASHLKPGPARSRQQPRHPIVCAHATDRKQRRRSRAALLKGATNSGRTVAQGAERLRCSLQPWTAGKGYHPSRILIDPGHPPLDPQ